MEVLINKKYEAIFNKPLTMTAPVRNDEDDDCEVMQEGENGEWVKAQPIGYEKEQLEWESVYGVIETGFIFDKDYVCWSDGGYTRKNRHNVLETREGRDLQKYDAVLLCGNFGEPMGFMVFSGEVIEDGDYVRPVFFYIGQDDEIHQYKPKFYQGTKEIIIKRSNEQSLT